MNQSPAESITLAQVMAMMRLNTNGNIPVQPPPVNSQQIVLQDNYPVAISASEMGRLWFVRIVNLHWNVIQPLILTVIERKWNSLLGSSGPCFCGKIHPFEQVSANCISALEQRAKQLAPTKNQKYSRRDTMWINVCQAPIGLHGRELLEDFFDLSNLDKLHFSLTLCCLNQGTFLRDDPAYKKYIVGGGLLDARHVASHERRARKWDEQQFTSYFQKLQTECLQLAKLLHGYNTPDYLELKRLSDHCLQSFTDMELESLILRLARQMARDGQDISTLTCVPENFRAKHKVSSEVAKQLLSNATPIDEPFKRRILCIPPMDNSALSNLDDYRTLLKFLCSIEWEVVVDFSGLQDGTESIPFFEPLPDNWIIGSPDTDDPRTGVYLGKASMTSLAFLEDASAQVVVPVPSTAFLATDHKMYSWIGHFFRTMDMVNAKAPIFIADSFEALLAIKNPLQKHVAGDLLSNIVRENTSSLLCSFALVQSLVTPAQHQILLPCQSGGEEQVVAVRADLWKFPNSELLHLHCGHLHVSCGDQGGEIIEEEDLEEEKEDEDDTDDDWCYNEEELDAHEEREALRLNRAVQQRLKEHALSFIQGTCPAHWALFCEKVVTLTDQMERVQHSIFHGRLRSFTLKHTFSSGGTTMLRHLLYNLREKFVCVSMWDFNDLQTLPALRTALHELHDLTGLDVVVLVDLCADAEYGGNVKVGLLNDLMKIPYVRILVCEHIGDNYAQHSVPQSEPTSVITSANPRAKADTKLEASLQTTDLVESLIHRTEEESRAIKEKIRELCGLVGRVLMSFDELNEGAHIPQDYFQNDGLLNTGRIKKEAVHNNWQAALVHLSRVNASVLLQAQYWPIEVLELSGILDSMGDSSPARALLSQFTDINTRDPLINIGFFLFGSTDYAERVKKVVARIVSLLTPSEVFVLKTVVFAALFAPGLKVDKSFMLNYTPSPLLLGLVSKTTATKLKSGGGKKEYLAINVPSVAYILAEHPTIFDAPRTGRNVTCLYDFMKNALLPHLDERGPGDPRARIQRRTTLRPILDRAFNVFEVWHWLQRPQTDNCKFSYLIQLLWDCNSSKDAIAEMYCQYAKMMALDNHVLSSRESTMKMKADRELRVLSHTAYHKQTIREKFDQEKCSLWASEHARVVVSFLTKSSRCREEMAFITKSKYSERSNEFNKCLAMLDQYLLAQMTAEVIPYRYATIHRRRLESYSRHLKDSGEKLDLDCVEEMCCLSERYFEQAIFATHHSWAFPLVGLAQCRAEMYELLLLHTQKNANRRNFDNLVDHIAGLPQRHKLPTILCATTVLGVKKSLSFLQEADIASTYIRKDDDQEHTRELILKTMKRLHTISGTKLSPAEEALSDVLRGQDTLYTDGDKCISYLLELSRPLASLHTLEALDEDVPNWKSVLELVMKLSAAAHVTHATSKLLHDEKLQNLLQFRVVVLVDKWKRAVSTGKAHGLGAHRAAVMLAVYYLLHRDEADAHPYHDKIPNLEFALREASIMAAQFQHTGTVRCFVARTVTLPKQPFASFVGINSNTALDQLKRSGRHNQHSDWANALKDSKVNVRFFDGEMCDDDQGRKSNSVFSTELNCNIRYHPNSKYSSSERDPPAKSKVKFAIGINDHGLWAYGLHVDE